MKKQLKKGSWILIGILVCLAVVFLSGCIIQKRVKPASVEGALAYMQKNYGKDNYEIKFLKENHVEPYEENVFSIDGSTFYGDVPARTETCYLGYSPKNDLYFFVFHSTDPKASSTYSTTLGKELETIEKFEAAKTYAKAVFGDRLKTTDIHIYAGRTFPFNNVIEFKPIYGKADSDVRSAYNRLLLETADPFSSNIMDISRSYFWFDVSPCFNVYVDYPLKELNQQMKEVIANFENISIHMLFIANDGIYNRPYLTIDMFNTLK